MKDFNLLTIEELNKLSQEVYNDHTKSAYAKFKVLEIIQKRKKELNEKPGNFIK